MGGVIAEREASPVQAKGRAENLDHIWTTAGVDFRTCAKQRIATGQEIPTPVQLQRQASLRSRAVGGFTLEHRGERFVRGSCHHTTI